MMPNSERLQRLPRVASAAWVRSSPGSVARGDRAGLCRPGRHPHVATFHQVVEKWHWRTRLRSHWLTWDENLGDTQRVSKVGQEIHKFWSYNTKIVVYSVNTGVKAIDYPSKRPQTVLQGT